MEDKEWGEEYYSWMYGGNIRGISEENIRGES